MGHPGALFIFVLSLSFSLACSEVVHDDVKDDHKTYIVRVRSHMKPSSFSDVEQWYKATLQSLDSNDPLTNSENPKPTQKVSQELLHVYSTVMHGFSTRLTKQQATQLSNKPWVVAVLPDGLLQLHTTRSPYFLGLYSSSDSINKTVARLLSESDSGSNVTIGILDTGICPEHHSFRDEGLGPIPPNWKGECVEGESFTKDNCNKKIIGARFFLDGYRAGQGMDLERQFMSARDSQGHGTHTASTAAGGAAVGASCFGHANGTAVGIAPKARIAVYKVCWQNGCMDSDILAGFNKAVEDGVDVISISIGGKRSLPYYLDSIAIGAFGAMEKGVSVIASAGNNGPLRSSVVNLAPWIMTVGASTIDRGFPADLVLADGRVINGSSLYNGTPLPENTYFTLIYGRTCTDELLSLDVRGKIVICVRANTDPAAKGEAIRKANGSGVVVANVDMVEDLFADVHVIPGLSINDSAGDMVRRYINDPSTYASAKIVFCGTELGIKPAPVVASFSARGPNIESSYVLKPDVIAPGVNILAAWPNGVPPTELPYYGRETEFNILSGTSMSCPHVAGVAALLKGAHPDWSPAMIRSSMMTTAYTQDKQGNPIRDNKAVNTESTVWDMGVGHIDPTKAVDPGLVYDITSDDYLNFLCASSYEIDQIRSITNSKSVSCDGKHSKPWDLNYPAISVELSPSEIVVINRTVTYVGECPADFSVTVTNPRSGLFNVTVNPMRMEFKVKGEKQRYSVRINATSAPEVDMDVGNIVWLESDGQLEVVSPVVATWTRS